jgi:hypothetical protein
LTEDEVAFIESQVGAHDDELFEGPVEDDAPDE